MSSVGVGLGNASPFIKKCVSLWPSHVVVEDAMVRAVATIFYP